MVIGLVCVAIDASGLLTKSSSTAKTDIQGIGTVRYVSIEGGFHGIIGDDGRSYDPTDLSEEFEVDGLRVRFTANKTDLLSCHMWGEIVNLIAIQKLL
jgi:hypothetical protein